LRRGYGLAENFQQGGWRGADRLYGRAARFPRGRRAAGGGPVRQGPDHLRFEGGRAL